MDTCRNGVNDVFMDGGSTLSTSAGAGADRVVVIGAGVGGLAAAIPLAHAGFDVTVLERASAPGGKMRALPTPAGPVDAGPTVLTMRPVFEALFASVDERLEDHVTLIAEDVLARHWWPDGASLDLLADEDASAAALRDVFGARAEGEFRAFSASAQRLFDAFHEPMMLAAEPTLGALTAHVLKNPGLIPAMAPLKSLARELAGRFSDRRLAQLFGRYATYVGGSPYRSPAILGLIWRAEAAGVWRVKGGMRSLAAALAALAEAKGARIRYGAHVSRIETDGDGVLAAIDASGERWPAGRVVFNGDPAALTQGLLGDEPRNAVKPDAVAPRSLSAYVWSYAAEPEGRVAAELAHHNVFFGRDPRAEFDALAAGAPPADPTLYVCAEDRGVGAAPPALERFEIIMNGPPVPPRRAASAPADPEERTTCRTLTFGTLEDFGVTFAPAPEVAALTTPSDFATLFPGSAGSLYGRSPHGLTAAFKRPTARTKVPGLYLAGGGAHPGAGVPMATLSGRRAAEAILTDHASTSRSRPTAMRGGMSTGSPTTAPARSPSSAS